MIADNTVTRRPSRPPPGGASALPVSSDRDEADPAARCRPGRGGVTHAVITVLAALGVFGQIVAGLTVLAGLLWLGGLRRPLHALRRVVWGYELWLAFLGSGAPTGRRPLS